MKYIKNFKINERISSKTIFKKYDIVTRRNITSTDVFILLENVHEKSEFINVIRLANIRYISPEMSASFVFNASDYSPKVRIQNKDLENISDINKKILFLEIQNPQKINMRYIKIIQNTLNMNLVDLKIYKDWLVEQDMNKYNL